MSHTNYILTSDGNFVSEDELYHYGVPGMKWGVRNAEKYNRKADIARVSAKEWLEIGSNKAAKLRAKGKEGKAVKVESKYKSYANKDLADSKKYSQKAQSYKNNTTKRAGKAKTTRGKDSISEYRKERNRQNKHIATKRAIDLGSRFVNSYTKSHNVTLNGKHVGIPDNAKLFVNTMLDYKYMKDTFK